MKLTWLGHACFKLETKGYTIVIDPFEDGSVPGLKPVREEADLVLCTHEHGDHNARHLIRAKNPMASPVIITSISTWHDDQNGALRGADTIYIIDDGDCRVAHLGDLGCALEPEQMKQLTNLDAVMVPIGGHFTIDASQARALIDQLHPRVVLPMHYRGDGFGYDVIGTLDGYLKLCSDVIHYDGNSIEITGDMQPQTAVLQLP
ncbi:MAG: MBL fold metallo-hydrolase [Clostridiales bacterium]|nr:MBL fold metallo-hydrolase [Clostridiales bacterium]